MGRPIKIIEQPAFLVHFGHIETWTNYGNGFGDDREVPEVKPNLMGKRACRWIRMNDCVCVDLHHVTCELCLKSTAAARMRNSSEGKRIVRNTKDPESRLFWKRLEESVAKHERETSPEERFQAYFWMERGKRIAVVSQIENKGSSHEKVVME